MFGTTRSHQPGLLSGTFHFIIIAFALQADSAKAWPYALLAMSVVSFCAWVANYRRYRQISDLPTAKVASAAQGYNEFFGHANLLPGKPIASRLSQRTCCWYSYEVEEKTSDDKWKTIDSGTSVEQFLLVDDTGECVVSPEDAEVLTKEDKTWVEGSYRYNECLLLPGEVLYAIGEFSTTAAGISARDERDDTGVLLSEWKQDRKSLLERFDLNKDGVVDLKEWELARLQAQREVRKRNAETTSRSADGTSILRKPPDGRLFLLADEMPDKLGARYRFWSWAHLVIFIGAGIAGLLML